jgi:DNA-binding transcriptional regulator GbsR (MarR family)
MQEIRHSIIEDFGNGYASFGNSELMGRVVGLFICASGPLNVDQVAEYLNISKSPVNQICNRLDELKLIRKVWVKGERKYHYQAVDEIFLQASLNLSRLTEGNLRIAEKNLQSLVEKYKNATPAEKQELRIMCKRLIEMREFNRRLIDSYQRFIDDWRSIRNSLPSVDEILT